MRRSVGWCVLLAVSVLTIGCGKKVPTVTFETKGFLNTYVARRDAFIRATAPAYLACVKVQGLTVECVELKQAEAEWDRTDALVYDAVVGGATVTTVDMEQAASALLKVLSIAARIAPLAP